MTDIQENTKEDDKKKNIHILYKNLGETPLQCIERFKKDNIEYENIPMTYAGRLDPMAEGVLIVLSGDVIQQKDTYLGLHKTYRAEILWGIATDTQDILGLVTEKKDLRFVPSENEIKDVLRTYTGKLQQSYPVYSSQPVHGKPLFQWAREGKLSEIEIPTHEVEILSPPTFISRRTVPGTELIVDIKNRVNLVSGDFRQTDILETWKDVFSEKTSEMCVIDTLEISVSSGFYVRQFVSDLAKKFETLATTYHIVRTKIGDFHRDL